MAQEAWRAYLELAYGMTEATTKKATKTVRRLVGKSGATADQLQGMAEDLLRAGSNNRDALTKLVRYELDRALGVVGLATADEVAALTSRVHELEAQLKETTLNAVAPAHEPAPPVGAEVIEATAPAVTAAPAPAAAPVKTVAKKAVAKKIPAKKAIEAVAAASDIGPASDKLPVKKTTRPPRKSAS
jgi:polyhydroxyalkanoate synthesis regulator phasin